MTDKELYLEMLALINGAGVRLIYGADTTAWMWEQQAHPVTVELHRRLNALG